MTNDRMTKMSRRVAATDPATPERFAEASRGGEVNEVDGRMVCYPQLGYAPCQLQVCMFKCTHYFSMIRQRPDRRQIKDEWIEQVMGHPEFIFHQADGRIRKWAKIVEADNRYLRVVLLEDDQTVHNAFFDRRFKGELG